VTALGFLPQPESMKAAEAIKVATNEFRCMSKLADNSPEARARACRENTGHRPARAWIALKQLAGFAVLINVWG
jgi:hypothetical protein